MCRMPATLTPKVGNCFFKAKAVLVFMLLVHSSDCWALKGVSSSCYLSHFSHWAITIGCPTTPPLFFFNFILFLRQSLIIYPMQVLNS